MNKAQERTIAVTGGSGLIGSHLLRRLREDGSSLKVLTRTPQPEVPGTQYIFGDLGDAASLRNLVKGATMVVHLAGIAHTSLPTEQSRLRAREINVSGTQRLLEAAGDAGMGRVIVTSSAHVYAGQSGIGLDESSPTLGDSVYAEMKLAAEDAASEARSNGLDVVVIRPCIVYGPGVRFNLASLMKAIRRGYYFHPGSVNPVRSFLSVDAATAAIVHLLSFKDASHTYNIADREPVHLIEWLDGLADRMRVRRPRTLPMGVLRATALLLSPVAALGFPAPLSTESLNKLTTSFSLNVNALARTGFLWPSTTNEILNQMVQASKQ
jgi:UDP-glucose 4-epimerase